MNADPKTPQPSAGAVVNQPTAADCMPGHMADFAKVAKR